MVPWPGTSTMESRGIDISMFGPEPVCSSMIVSVRRPSPLPTPYAELLLAGQALAAVAADQEVRRPGLRRRGGHRSASASTLSISTRRQRDRDEEDQPQRQHDLEPAEPEAAPAAGTGPDGGGRSRPATRGPPPEPPRARPARGRRRRAGASRRADRGRCPAPARRCAATVGQHLGRLGVARARTRGRSPEPRPAVRLHLVGVVGAPGRGADGTAHPLAPVP